MIQFVLKRMALVAVALSLSATAFAGKDRGGGNVFEAEFKQLGYQTRDEIKAKGLRADQIGFELIRLDVALNEVRILGTDKPVTIEDQPRMAINSPVQKLIIFSNSSWMILNPQQKQLLVLHEYLRFVGVDDSEYTFSLRIVQLLKAPSGSTPIPPAPSARVRVLKVVSVKQNPYDWIGDSIDERSGASYQVILYCKTTHSNASLWLSFNPSVAASLSLPEKIRRVLPKRDACDAMNNLLRDINNGNPVKLIIDPIRALTEPNDYLTIEY
ncbi:MAG: hypothetical protein ACJ763_01880 [Bdellovibrionia bacterium]